MTPEEIKLLAIAKDNLENPNVFIKITDCIGMPIEFAIKKLPESARKKTGEIVQKSLEAAYWAAKMTIVEGEPSWTQTYLNRMAVTVSGGFGGAGGLPSAIIEIPFSTTVFFREMMQNAMIHGFDVRDSRICLEVMSCFSYGGKSTSDDASETGYFAIRASLAKPVSEAAEYLAKVASKAASEKASKAASKTADDLSRPIIIKFIEKIASRFGVVVSDELMAKLVPGIGAVCGIAVNNLFIHHFSNISDAHFFILKLESKYGKSVVKENYDKIDPIR